MVRQSCQTLLQEAMWCKTKPAMAARNTPSKNVFAHVTQFTYKRYVPYISECDAVTRESFEWSKLSKQYVLDTSLVYQNGQPNTNHIFDLFGSLSSHNAANVRFLLLSDIAADVEFYQKTSCVCLEMRNINFHQWITNLSLESMYADELTLFSLSWLYKQHTVVITANKLWSTLHLNDPVSKETLLNVCSVCFVYLGHLRFGVLRLKIHTPEFVMVPVAAGGPTKATTSYHSMQAQLVTKLTTVTNPPQTLHVTCKDVAQDVSTEIVTAQLSKGNTVPGTALNIAKSESSDEDTPLPVGTTPTNTETVTINCAKNTGNVEMISLDKKSEYVETELCSNDLPVEMLNLKENNKYVETNPSRM